MVLQNGMVGNMYGVRNGLRPEEQPAKRLKPSQVQAVMKGNHGTSLVEAMSAEEIHSHLENLRVRRSLTYSIAPVYLLCSSP